MSKRGRDSAKASSGGKRTPTPPAHRDYCVECLVEGLPEPLAWISPEETMYHNERGEPVCQSHGEAHNLTAMED